ncbi:MAG: lipocalin family protein [Enterococcus sp.]
MAAKTYELVVTSPMGKKEGGLKIAISGTTFTGSLSFMGQDVEIENGQFNKEGNFSGYSIIKSPIGKMKCEVTGTIIDDIVTGQVKTKMGNITFVSKIEGDTGQESVPTVESLLKKERHPEKSRNFRENKGVPMSIDAATVLTAKPDKVMDSWYISCACESNGHKLGFVWHQMFHASGFSTAELLLMDGESGKSFTNLHMSETDEQTFTSMNHLQVVSPIATLIDTGNGWTLKAHTENGTLEATILPKDDIYVGATGALELHRGALSYEYAYPNMVVNGKIVLDSIEYPFSDAVAWFDRQYAELISGGHSIGAENMFSAGADGNGTSWLWAGMSLCNDSVAMMMTDINDAEKRSAFATLTHENGTHVNTKIDVSYDEIWQSKKSGYYYPNKINVKVPYEDITMTLEVICSNDFHHTGGGLDQAGCQSLCKVDGVYKGKDFSKLQIVEFVGNTCGDWL